MKVGEVGKGIQQNVKSSYLCVLMRKPKWSLRHECINYNNVWCCELQFLPLIILVTFQIWIRKYGLVMRAMDWEHWQEARSPGFHSWVYLYLLYSWASHRANNTCHILLMECPCVNDLMSIKWFEIDQECWQKFCVLFCFVLIIVV